MEKPTKKIPKISDAEWEVMNLVWEKSPITANDIVEGLTRTKSWNHKTIGTFINRLTKKGALRFEQQGKRYLYYPKIARGTYIKAESRFFLERIFCGQGGPLLAHFVKEVELSPTEISSLEKILAEKGRPSCKL